MQLLETTQDKLKMLREAHAQKQNLLFKITGNLTVDKTGNEIV